MVIDLLQKVWENGGIQISETVTPMCNARQKRRLTDEFVTRKNYREETRTIAGVAVTTIETDFGRLAIMLNRCMPTDPVQVVSLGRCAPVRAGARRCAPVMPEKPGQGFLFSEPLAKTGYSDRAQIYGEISLEYGPEIAHGKITGLTGIGA